MPKTIAYKWLILVWFLLVNILVKAQSSLEYYRSGKSNYDSSLYQLAINDFSKSISLNPNFDSIYYYRGYAFLQVKDTIAADKDWLSALRLNPKYNRARLNHAFYKYCNKEYELAILELDTILQIDNKLYDALFSRAVSNYELGNKNAVVKDLNRYIKYIKTDAAAYFNRASALEDLKKYKSAIADYKKSIELNPQDASAYCNLGNIMYNSKKYKEALVYFNNAIKFDSTMKQAHYGRGLVNNSTDNDAEAIDDFNRALSLDPKYDKAFVGRGVAYSHLGNYQAALENYSKSIELKPKDNEDGAVAYYNRGNMKVKLDDIDGAIQDYKIAYGFGYKAAKKEIDILQKQQ